MTIRTGESKRVRTVTVGIPAFNEEDNIGYLLEQLLSQKTTKVRIEKIIISSDGSSDNTVKIARSFNDNRILVLNNRSRKGQSVRQNQVISLAKSDYLLLLNADILLKGNLFVEDIAKKAISTKSDLVSSKIEPLPPQTYFEKILCTGYQLKESIFEAINNGVNIYTCKGAARIMSKDLYKHFRFSDSIGEDAYSYLYTVKNMLAYSYEPNAVANIRLPNNLNDHLKQSIRFINSMNKFSHEFESELIKSEYQISSDIKLSKTIKSLINMPVETVLYIIVTFYANLLSQIKNSGVSNTWDISRSSKKLIIN